MNKVLVDTNIWLRYFAKDDRGQHAECKSFFDLVDEGKIMPYVSNVTLMELAYTLQTFYKFEKNRIGAVLGEVLKTRNITILERTYSPKAMIDLVVTKVKYQDCLIAGQLKKGMKLVSYDKDFDKLIPGKRKEPKDMSSPCSSQ